MGTSVSPCLLDGRGADVAITCLPEDPARSPTISATRRELAGAVATAAVQLRDVYKLRPRDRVLFHMPTDAVHFVYMLACQRLVGPAARRVIDTRSEPPCIDSEGVL
jgi:acyl-coenzyme A synthetase/AMP-(fatty) acid ligase